jgi:hypothetical protein
MKLTRRQLAAVVSATALTQAQAKPQAQDQAKPQSEPRAAGAADEMETARGRLKANSELLAQHEVPMATEPAFRFQA